MRQIYNIIFFICNLSELSHKLFEKNTNKIIDVIENNLIHNYSNNNLNIYYEKRIKSKKRIISKLQKFKIPYDIYGLRIIYNSNTDYYNIKIAYIIKNIIYDNFNTLDFISDDYIARPKNNNYQSLHVYIVFNLLIEIQIRNTNMHNVSVNGTASDYYL
jgi:(p)ppGpp synthase/HD superfamily hydrolase